MNDENDGRWDPGAVWEHTAGSDVATFTLQRVRPDGEAVFFDAVARVRWSARDTMIEANGWRFVGKEGA